MKPSPFNRLRFSGIASLADNIIGAATITLPGVTLSRCFGTRSWPQSLARLAKIYATSYSNVGHRCMGSNRQQTSTKVRRHLAPAFATQELK
ncbi:MAG: hypothetical protein V4819_24255 [Verrucomicrobiota bacterium]